MGKVVVIDGLDGCGKATQADLLVRSLRKEGMSVYTRDFPNYNSPSSIMAREFLRGTFGHKSDQVPPELASCLFAIDRGLTVLNEGIDEIYKSDTTLIFDRYFTSNWIYHGVKISNQKDRMEFFEWSYNLEVEKFNVPPIDVAILLSIPVDTSVKLITSRYKNDDSKKDILESDIHTLNKCRDNLGDVYQFLSEKTKHCELLDCSTTDGWIQDKYDIASKIYGIVKQYI